MLRPPPPSDDLHVFVTMLWGGLTFREVTAALGPVARHTSEMLFNPDWIRPIDDQSFVVGGGWATSAGQQTEAVNARKLGLVAVDYEGLMAWVQHAAPDPASVPPGVAAVRTLLEAAAAVVLAHGAPHPGVIFEFERKKQLMASPGFF